MYSKLVSNIAKHFLFSVFQHDSESAERISDIISQQSSQEIIEFLLTLGGILDGHFTILENVMPEYGDRRLRTCDELKSSDNDEEMEESTCGGHFSEYECLEGDWDE